MNNRLKLFAATALMLVVACSEAPKTSYTIQGTATGLADGTKLLLADGDGQALDTLVVSDGKFTYSGPADSVSMIAIYELENPVNNVSFFTEPGTHSIELTTIPGKAHIAGTEANNGLQTLNEAIFPYMEKLQQIQDSLEQDTTALYHGNEWAITERVSQIYKEIEKRFLEAAEKNIGNELGYTLLVTTIDEKEYASEMRQLLEKMPQAYRERERVKQLVAYMDALDATKIGQTITDFTLNTPEGEPLSVMSLVQQNKVTILDFWASWCGPCRREMPFMKELYAEYHPKGLGIIGISLDENAAEWNRAISDLKIEWPQISDLQGWNSSAAQTFQVNAIPFLVILDNEGKILQKGLRGEELKNFISELL